MTWTVHVKVTCLALDERFRVCPGEWWEPMVDFATLEGVLAFLKSCGSMSDFIQFEDYADVVREEGRAIRRALKERSTEDLEAVSAEVARVLKKLRED